MTKDVYTEEDVKAMQSIHDDSRRKAKDTIAKFLEKRSSKVHGLWVGLCMDPNQVKGECMDDLEDLLYAVNLVSDELLAWARSEQS